MKDSNKILIVTDHDNTQYDWYADVPIEKNSKRTFATEDTEVTHTSVKGVKGHQADLIILDTEEDLTDEEMTRIVKPALKKRDGILIDRRELPCE